MPTTLQAKILLLTLKYDFKVMQRENSPNEVQKRYPRGRNFFGIQTVQMGYCTPKWATVGNPVNRSMDSIYPNRVTHVMQQVHHLNEMMVKNSKERMLSLMEHFNE